MEPSGIVQKLRGTLLKSIVWKLLVPTPILVALGSILVIAIVPPMIEYNVRQAARDVALEKVQQFRTVRNLYSRNIVRKLSEDFSIKTTIDHVGKPKVIPAPATFVHDIGKALEEEGLTLKFYSPYPFKTRRDHNLDEFGKTAWEQLRADSDAVVLADTVKNGKRMVRVAVGDRLVEESCVNCHNTHPLSVKNDWKLGDLRGVFELEVDVERLLNAGERVIFVVVVTFFVIGLVIVLLGILIGRRIAGRLWQMREAVESVANGRLAVSIPETNSDDEIDALGSALSVFRDNAQRKLELEIKQGELNEQISTQNEELSQTNSAIERFVPRTFLELMDKKSIVAVELGDYVERDMTILFSDIRDFTTLSEEMTPNDNFKFINNYLNKIGPIISKNNGFIDKYIGDAIMALFDSSDEAVAASIEMIRRLEVYNRDERVKFGRTPISIGVGLNTGSLMLGTIGESGRMDGTVISDAVNLASRVEGLTKQYSTPIIISEYTFRHLSNPDQHLIRQLDVVTVKGKSERVSIYEVFETDEENIRAAKHVSREKFEEALMLMKQEEFEEAHILLHECLEICPDDYTAHMHFERCRDEVIGRELTFLAD